MGTPDFAAAILKQLLERQFGEITACYTQPDRPSGRGQKTKPSAVKQLAIEHGLCVLQPVNFKDEQTVQELKKLQPDILLVAAYGLILPQEVLDIPSFGAINVHASLLPRYRGAAPIQRAIQNGDKVSGISIMQMEKGLDTGPIFLQRSLAISPDEHSGTIHNQLAELGGRLVLEILEMLANGAKLQPQPQNNALASYAAKIEKSETLIDPNKTALEIHNTIRAFYPFPGTHFFWKNPNGKEIRLNLVPGKIGDKRPKNIGVGEISLQNDHLALACQDFYYLLPAVKPAGKKEQTAKVFANGYLTGLSS